MIITFDELPFYRESVVLVDGAFDPLHAGHLLYFHAAAAFGRPLLCNIASDSYVRTKHPPLLPDWQRAAVIDTLRPIAYTHLNESTTEDVLEQLQPAIYCKGIDWQGRLPPQQVALCRYLGVRIAFVDTVIESSSRLLTQAGRAATPTSAASAETNRRDS